MSNQQIKTPVGLAGQVLIIATVWVTLYIVNDWLFSQLAISDRTSWIFLPAALRMLAVMLLGWVGALGLFVGSLLTGWFGTQSPQLDDLIVVSGISALAPLFAYFFSIKILRIRSDLRGLNASCLLMLSVVCAAVCAGLHSAHFSMAGYVQEFFDVFVPMFAGDLIGTLIVLYAAKIVIGLMGSGRAETT